MPSYRVEAWFNHQEHDIEDQLEELLADFMKRNRMYCQGGPVVFRVYPNGEPVRLAGTASL